MLTTDELRALIADHESDRVELTASTTNTDEFGEAVCAFANDLPNHRQPGYVKISDRITDLTRRARGASIEACCAAT